ncbi:MAG: DUF2807 domain-containing protein [Chitinophagaceae bacterium]|nr:DUF2807 domain-containing protein [Chitinophagaceae bacterium]
MKRNFSSTLILLSAFLLFNSASAQKKERETIEGNGKLVTRDVSVQPFNSLKASGVYELKLSQGNTETVKIEADENLQEYFTVKNEGTTLVIDMKKMENKNFNAKNKLRVYVTFKKLNDIELHTVGNVVAEDHLTFDNLELSNNSVGNINLKMSANKIDLENNGVGNITLTGKAQNAVFKNSGVGSLKAGDFVVQTMNIENIGVGSAEVNAEKELKVEDSFLGKVKNKGSAPLKKKNKVVI